MWKKKSTMLLAKVLHTSDYHQLNIHKCLNYEWCNTTWRSGLVCDQPGPSVNIPTEAVTLFLLLLKWICVVDTKSIFHSTGEASWRSTHTHTEENSDQTLITNEEGINHQLMSYQFFFLNGSHQGGHETVACRNDNAQKWLKKKITSKRGQLAEVVTLKIIRWKHRWAREWSKRLTGQVWWNFVASHCVHGNYAEVPQLVFFFFLRVDTESVGHF